MGHVQWCVGNTTLREARRIKDALKVLKENFDGKPWSYDNQKKFLELLSSTRIADSSDLIYDMGSAKSPKQIEQHGRIWSSAFNELGFATCYKKGNKFVPGGVRVTKVGEALLSGEFVEEDLWLRQLLKIQLPNPFPQKSKSQYPGFALLPFSTVLKIIKECDGVSKDEGFIINTIKTSREVDSAIKLVKKYRKSLVEIKHKGKNETQKSIIKAKMNWASKLYADEIRDRFKLIKKFETVSAGSSELPILQKIIKGGKGSKTKKALKLKADLVDLKRQRKSLKEMKGRFLDYFLKLKSGSWSDYIDATARYFRMSGILTVRRNKITIAETHQNIAQWIISKEWPLLDDKHYLDYLHNPALPVLPQDDTKFVNKTSQEILKKLGSRLSAIEKSSIGAKVEEAKDDPLKTRKLLVDLLITERELKEKEYMEKLHSSAHSIDEIIEYFGFIIGKEILGDRPTHFEWNVWRGFLAIDKLNKHPQECRNFRIDDDLQPVSHAPGNKPDMIFSYVDFTLVVEVTLQTGPNQYNTESEPVPRHVIKVISQQKGRPVYALFIAPKIDINTAMHFYGSMTSVPIVDSDRNRIFPFIIPITLDEYTFLLEIFKKKGFLPSDLRILFEQIISLRNSTGIADGGDWLKEINGVIKKWGSSI